MNKQPKLKLKSTLLEKMFGGSFILLVVVILLGAYGYVRCVVKFCECDFSNQTSWKPEIVYGIGTFTLLGVGIGYLELGK